MAGQRLKRACGLLAVAIAATVALGAAVALAVGGEDVESQGVCCRYTASTYSSDQGETAQFVNPPAADSSHNVTAKDNGPDGRPLFRSKTISAGRTSQIDGLQYLAGGSYKFVCTIHGPPMIGTYVVDGTKGAPVARPRIDVTLPKQGLSAVRNSGKLKVKVRALTRSAGISLDARKGRKRLGTKSGLTLAAGASRTIVLTLTTAGRKALKGLKSASISVKGSVAFGRPDSARRNLH